MPNETTSQTNCVPLRMRPERALALIREIAQDSAKVLFSRHARERMVERDITDLMAMSALRSGYVKGDVDVGANAGEWKVKVCWEAKGRRQVGVVVLILKEGRLLVKTVEWEDP